jgi:drug/metabolite transporter (DMT)-like permease
MRGHYAVAMRIFYSIVGTLALLVAGVLWLAAVNFADNETQGRDMTLSAATMALIGIGFMVGAAAFRPVSSALRSTAPPAQVPTGQPGWAASPAMAPGAPAQPGAGYQQARHPGM